MWNETYSRGQVTWAVWQLFIRARYDDPKRQEPAPSEFLHRIKKMWEHEVPISADERPGTGTSIEYTPYHAFELAVALTLQDMGLKQAEVAEFVRGRRTGLQRRFDNLSKPSFLLFRLVEIREGHQLFKRGPLMIQGGEILTTEGVMAELGKLRGNGRIVLELAGIAERVNDYLRQAPEIRRGRP